MERISVSSDEVVTDELVVVAVVGNFQRYIHQEMIKLAFDEISIARNYMCRGSDGVFIRNFSIRDLVFDSETPFTVMFEHNELRTDLDYFNTHWCSRSLSLDKIREVVGLAPQSIITCQGFAFFSSEVIRSLRTDFMQPRGLSFADLLAISPFEFSW
jgi:hypothetical protein